MSDEVNRYGSLAVIHLAPSAPHFRSVGIEYPFVCGDRYVGVCQSDIDIALLTPERDPDRSRALREMLAIMQRGDPRVRAMLSDEEIRRAAQLAADWINGVADGGPIVMVKVEGESDD